MNFAEFLGTFAYLALLLLSGYAVVGWLGRGRPMMETIGLSACLGPAVAGFFLIAASMLGRQPSDAVLAVLAIVAGASVVCCWIVFRGRPKPANRASNNSIWFALAFLIIAAYGVTIIGKEAFLSPVVAYDAFDNWQLKAKVLHHQLMIPRPGYFFDPGLSYSHQRYPILVPMISAGAMTIAGDRDGLGKPPFVLLYLGMALTAFAFLCREHGSFIAALVTILFITVIPFFAYGGAGTADLALTAFYTASLIYLLCWLEQPDWKDLFLTSLFSAAMAWAKNEGLAMACINGLILLVFTPRFWQPRRMGAIVLSWSGVGAFCLAWAIYSHGIPRTDEDYPSHFTLSRIFSNLDRLPAILHGFFLELSLMRHWALLWITLILTAVLGYDRLLRRPILALWTVLLLQAGVLVLACMVSVFSVNELLPASVDRLVLQLTPAAALLIGYQCHSIAGTE